ncbi:type I glyceraldehyde-3-phosphate dehydrogenase [Gracilibacillus sp. YIM 98692]|uniref:type I glyceraldehyde-3-phosphate dehydrogenase n=1 Tax=Gracilibacillus sp. YIM 98692 TaxID=2663532 RepID=UPI0013D2EDBF|nr:type I glyceraldehyde-3-phosphate dehydrogenase [Gracilibacillus sp. YIM 98692]
MEIGIGVSGTGRIGRLLIRKMMTEEGMRTSLKAINSVYSAETIAHLLKYDSVHGKWDADISASANELRINGNVIHVVYHREPANIPWGKLGVDLAIDATGKFRDKQSASGHIHAGATSVIVTAPGKDLDLTVVMGVNEQLYNPEKHTYISAASCTTNCVAPVLKVLDDRFHIQKGWVTSIHSITSDQKPLDNPHKDLRRARASTQSIVPTTTGVGKALKDVLPHLASKMEGTAVRVPTQDVSLADLTVQVDDEYTADEVRAAFESASEGEMNKIVGSTNEPLVSVDYIGSSQSATVDGLSLEVMGDQIKVLAWYDNEWAYTCRVAELSHYMKARMIENEKLQKSS